MFTKGHRLDGPPKCARVVLTDEGRSYCTIFGLILAIAVALLIALVVDKINDANKMDKKQRLLVSALTAIEEKAEEMRLAMDQT